MHREFISKLSFFFVNLESLNDYDSQVLRNSLLFSHLIFKKKLFKHVLTGTEAKRGKGKQSEKSRKRFPRLYDGGKRCQF